MLKIKDNVDLKELGFEEKDCIFVDSNSLMCINKDTREIYTTKYFMKQLFDLIQAGLVEKVEEK